MDKPWIQFETLRTVIRGSVVKNQDEQIATVLLTMVNYIEYLAHLEQSPVLPPHRHQYLAPHPGYVGDSLETTPPIPEEPAETPSSVDTEMPEETKPTWSISREWSSLVSLDGKPLPSARVGISDWLSSIKIPGNVPEVVIGVMLISKGSTPPDGSPSPSTVAPIQEGSGHAGVQGHEGERCQDCGKRYETVYAAPNHIWNELVNPHGAGMLCLPCFETRCSKAGVVLRWVGEYLGNDSASKYSLARNLPENTNNSSDSSIHEPLSQEGKEE